MLARGVSGTSLSATDTSVVHANFWPCGFDSVHVSSGGVNPQGRGGGGPPLRKDQGLEGVIGKMMAAIEQIQGLATSWRVWSPMDWTSTLWTSPPADDLIIRVFMDRWAPVSRSSSFQIQ